MVETRASGLHIYTEPNFGIQVGLIERELVYPVSKMGKETCVDYLLGNPQSASTSEKTVYMDTPVTVTTDRSGFGMEFLLLSVNVNFGLSNKRITYVSDFNYFSYFYISTGSPDKPKVCAIAARKEN